jgi:branched-chain amino acid transport system substrate-binding protein
MLGNSVVSTSRRVLSALFIGLALTGTALAQQPLKIGFGMSLTGPLAGNGKAALIAMEIWARRQRGGRIRAQGRGSSR